MMILRTRKEQYLNEIVGNGNTAPGTPYTREELFFADILGEVNAPAPVTRIEIYLAKIANKYNRELPQPKTRIEKFIARAAGMDVIIPTPITREEMLWANYSAVVERELSGIPPLTFTAKNTGALKNYRIYGGTVNGESVGDLVTSGDHAGEYKVPVTVSNGTDTLTTPIYLPEQIKKVGDEAEYIDYSEQKQHRVRKNLFNGALIDGVYEDNTLNNVIMVTGVFKSLSVYLNAGTYTLSFSTNVNVVRYVEKDVLYTVNPAINVSSYTFTLFNANSIGFSFRDTTSSTTQWDNNINIMLNSGSEPLPYEPYIENTDLDITLPALPTLPGTNTLSVGTEVQPSDVYIKYEGAR